MQPFTRESESGSINKGFVGTRYVCRHSSPSPQPLRLNPPPRDKAVLVSGLLQFTFPRFPPFIDLPESG